MSASMSLTCCEGLRAEAAASADLVMAADAFVYVPDLGTDRG